MKLGLGDFDEMVWAVFAKLPEQVDLLEVELAGCCEGLGYGSVGCRRLMEVLTAHFPGRNCSL